MKITKKRYQITLHTAYKDQVVYTDCRHKAKKIMKQEIREDCIEIEKGSLIIYSSPDEQYILGIIKARNDHVLFI